MKKNYFGIKQNFEIAEYLRPESGFSAGCKYCLIVKGPSDNPKLNPKVGEYDLYSFELLDRQGRSFFDLTGWNISAVKLHNYYSKQCFLITTIEDPKKEVERVKSDMIEIREDKTKYAELFISVLKKVIDYSKFDSIQIRKIQEKNDSLRSENDRLKTEIKELREQVAAGKISDN